MAEVQGARLARSIGTYGLSHGYIRHLQIGHPWHDALPRDHMIGQEKLVTAKGRTELLFPQRGSIALYQRMEGRG